MKGTRGEYRCSFCGKAQKQVERLIAGPGGVYICNECISLCQEIIAEERASRAGWDRPPVAQPGSDGTAKMAEGTERWSQDADANVAGQLAPLATELAAARATIERLARDNGALRERVRVLGGTPD